jgi:mono/diheme cytochrome c family protein
MSRLLRRALRVIGYLFVVVIGLAAVVVSMALGGFQRKFDVPDSQLRASSDPAIIEKGRAMAYGPARCVECHVNRSELDAVRAGSMDVTLAGGGEFPIPLGTIRAPNITMDVATGIGSYTDSELVGALRHGVKRDRSVLIPFMEYQQMSDEDVVALLSFLRAQTAVRRVVPTHDLNLLGKVVTAFVVTPPPGPGTWPAASPIEEPTVERGAYVAEAVATCAACHTARSKTDGSFTSPRYSGGGEFEVEGEPDKVWVSPNLTPAASGWIAQWTEDQFVGRFRSAVAQPKTPMPWRLYSRMSEVDLRAIYRYLRTLDPVETPLAPVLRERAG